MSLRIRQSVGWHAIKDELNISFSKVKVKPCASKIFPIQLYFSGMIFFQVPNFYLYKIYLTQFWVLQKKGLFLSF